MAGSLIKNDPGWRETAKLWQEERAWLEYDYPEAVLVAEWSNPIAAINSGYHIDFLIHFDSPGYNALFRKNTTGGIGTDRYGFSFFDRSGHGNIRAFLDTYLKHYEATRSRGYIGLVTGNHDIAPRLSNFRNADDLELCFLFLLTMPGVPFIYYGDEIGMRSLDGLPSKEGGFQRTAVRTPMQWDASSNAGFSTAPAESLYLPVDERTDRPTVAGQENDPASLLNRVRRLSALRHAHPAFQADGELEIVLAKPGELPFVFVRRGGGETILVALNPGSRACDVVLPGNMDLSKVETLFGREMAFTREAEGWRLKMEGVEAGVWRV
jgi:glycosidase